MNHPPITVRLYREPDPEPLSDALTRRGLLGGVLGAAAVATVAACGSSSTTDGAGRPATRAVATAKGTVRVPVDPKRIVTIQPSATATLYDVGVNPLAVYDEGAQYISPRYRTKWEAAAKVGSDGQIDVEKVAAERPDLVIGLDYSWNTDVYGKLTDVAPTVIAPVTSWEATASTVADAVGRGSALTALKDRLKERASAISSTYADVLGHYRWDILQGGFDKGRFWLYGPASDAGLILASAGVRFAPGSAGVKGNGPKSLSYERIDVLADADVIGFYAGFDDKPNNEGPQLFAQPGFTRLAAAKAGRTVPFPDFLPGGYGDALAILDELEAGLKRLAA